MLRYNKNNKYDGTLKSLSLKSRKLHSHTKEELELIKKIYFLYKIDGLAEVFVQLKKRGYLRCYGIYVKTNKKKLYQT